MYPTLLHLTACCWGRLQPSIPPPLAALHPRPLRTRCHENPPEAGWRLALLVTLEAEQYAPPTGVGARLSAFPGLGGGIPFLFC